jgi:hypothetical protein
MTAGRVYEACEDRGTRPIIPLRQTIGVKRGDHEPPRKLYKGRAAVEREFGRLKNDWALATTSRP